MHLIVEQNRSAAIASFSRRPIPRQGYAIIDNPLIEIDFRSVGTDLKLRRCNAFLLRAIELPHPQPSKKCRDTQRTRQ